MPILTLLTDFGTTDWYVAAVKGVVLSWLPAATLVDISHHVPPGDVATAAHLLAAAAPTFPAGTVHLAVVDPGVGSARRLLALRHAGMVLLAPDNGLLTPFLGSAVAPPAGELRAIERPDLYLAGVGNTFHGRDRFAPVAAALLAGEPFARLGPLVADPRRLLGAAPEHQTDELRGRVVHVDRFGNLVTDIPTAWLTTAGAVVAQVGDGPGGRRALRRADHYAELPPGEPGILPGSLGTLELALPSASLAALWGVERGATVVVRLTPA
jgi:S-adenosylmethionine hydrolase